MPCYRRIIYCMNPILDFVSKKLKIDAHYLYKGFFWIGIATAVVLFTNFVKSTVFAHYLEPQTFGTYRYILSIIEIASAISLSGASAVISRSVAQGYEGTYRKGMWEYLKSSLLSVLATTGVCFYFIFKDNALLGITIGIAGLLAPLFRTLTMYGSLLEGKKQFALNAKYQIFSTTIPALILMYTVTVSHSILIILLSYFISYIVVHGVLTLLTEKILKPNDAFDPKSKAFTLHLSIMGILSTVTEQLDKILLFHFIGAAQLAVYSFASALPEQFNLLGKALRSLINPKLSNQSITSIKRHIFRRAVLISSACLVLFLGYIVVAPFIFHYFFVRYESAVLMSQVYALSIFLMVSIPYRLVLLAHSCTKELYQVKIVSIAVRLASLAIMLPLFGIWGVIVSFLLARFVEAGLFMYMVHFKITEQSNSHNNIEALE